MTNAFHPPLSVNLGVQKGKVWRGANCSLFKSEPDNDRLRGETSAHNNTCEFKEQEGNRL